MPDHMRIAGVSRGTATVRLASVVGQPRRPANCRGPQVRRAVRNVDQRVADERTLALRTNDSQRGVEVLTATGRVP
jgi:hypothetical protein